MTDVPKPLKPGEDLETQWKKFKWDFAGHVQFDAVRSRWNAETKAKYLVQCIGIECDYLHADATEQQKADPTLLMGYIDTQVKPTLNSCFERYLFKQIKRLPGEDLNLYVSRCKEKLESCGLAEGTDVNVFLIDALVHNLEDLTLQQLIFRTSNEELTLAKTMELIKVHEAGKKQLNEIQAYKQRLQAIAVSNSDHSHDAAGRSNRHSRPRSRSSSRDGAARSPGRHGVKHNSPYRRRSTSNQRHDRRGSRTRSKSPRHQQQRYQARSSTPRRRNNSVSNGEECVNCGQDHGEGWCPATNRQCHACGKRGHFAFKCRNDH